MQNTKVAVKGSEKEKDERVKGRHSIKKNGGAEKTTLNAGGIVLQECL